MPTFHFTFRSPEVLALSSVNGNPRLEGSERELALRLFAVRVSLSAPLLSFQAPVSLIFLSVCTATWPWTRLL